MDRDSPDYNEGQRAGVFYAQSWALLHYLMLGNDERRGQFSKFLALNGEGKPVDEAFQRSFGITYAQLERELKAYVSKFTMILLARNIIQRLEGSGDPSPDQLLKARALFTKAAELDPESSRAWMGIGITYLAGRGDVRPGIAAMEKARVLTPGDDDVRNLLARLHEREQVRLINEAVDLANSGKDADALAVLDRVIPEMTDAEMLRNAQRMRNEIAKRVRR